MAIDLQGLKIALEDFAHKHKLDPKSVEKALSQALKKVFQEKYKFSVSRPEVEPEVDLSKGKVRVILRFPQENETQIVTPEQLTYREINRLMEEFKSIIKQEQIKTKLSTIQAYLNKLVECKIYKVDKNKRVLVKVKDLDVDGRIEPSGIVKVEENREYKPGKEIKAVVLGVDEKSPYPVILSRSDPRYVQALLESTIPELQDGTVQIVSIAREAGVMTKIAVKSRDPFVPAVASLLGPKGLRLNAIKSHLPKEEIIDVIPYDTDFVRFAVMALQPAKGAVAGYDTGEEIHVFYEDEEEVLKAKGKEGINVILASRLVGKKISVHHINEFKPPEKGVTLFELKDKLPPEIYNRLKENYFVYFSKMFPLAYLQRMLGTDEATTIRILDVIEDALREKGGENV